MDLTEAENTKKRWPDYSKELFKKGLNDPDNRNGVITHLEPVHAKMGSIKDRNDVDLTEAENTKKRWPEYSKELFKKGLNDPDNRNGVITHLEPDILECEVKWALGSITINKASGGDGIPAELFQILKDAAVKVLHSICQQI